ncbi:MAG: adaptor protein MecA [Clostridiales bacterium]|nr:adaptor protein MecA [Clostridiales bacterium]
MNIIAQTENRICIELTHEDMIDLDITYEELDYSNIETRRVLWTLLDEARQALGWDVSLTQRLLIEAVPDSGGGCMIFFTLTDREQENQGEGLVKGAALTAVCRSESIDNIGALACVLGNKGSILKSELYTDGKNYRLIVQPEIGFKGDIYAVASEFCDTEDENAAAFTREHWKMLLSPDAVGVLKALK